MKRVTTLTIALLAILSAPLPAQESKSKPENNNASTSDAWTRTLDPQAKRGALSDRRELVRGDSGKWNDEPRLQVAPSIERKPADLSLDDWADQLAEKELQLKSDDESWLVFRTRQLDDNDRVWVETIERRGNDFIIVLNEAIWQGNYRKTFTGYEVIGVNLGKLEPGSYRAKWIIQPLQFDRFEDPGQPKDNWPKDARPADGKLTEQTVAFTVAPPPQ